MARWNRSRLFSAVYAKTSGFILGIELQSALASYVGIDYSGAGTSNASLTGSATSRLFDAELSVALGYASGKLRTAFPN